MNAVQEAGLLGMLGRVVSRLPQWPPSLVFVLALNLGFDLWAKETDLSELVGHIFQIQVTDLGLRLTFERRYRQFAPVLNSCKPHLVISASSHDFWQLLHGEEDPDTLFFNRRLLVEGDTELGLLSKNLLESIDWPLFHK